MKHLLCSGIKDFSLVVLQFSVSMSGPESKKRESYAVIMINYV